MDDDERFTALFRSLYPLVLAFARRRVGPDLAEEVVEDTFLAAWRQLAKLPADPLPWLYRAASYEVSQRYRQLDRDDRLRTLLTVANRASRPIADPADELTWSAQWVTAFASLGDRDREVLRLAAWERISPHQAAGVLGCSVAAYKVRLHRARRRLARLLQPDAGPPLDPAPATATPAPVRVSSVLPKEMYP
ncbi:MAG: RNA polymerase sigma factor [Acidimicrobiales bacterium]